MTLSVQNDAGTQADAISYIDVAQFKAYHAARGNSWGGANDETIEQALVKATDYIDWRFRYRGRKAQIDQTTQWPRSCARDDAGRNIFGVPKAIKDAQAEYALRALSSTLAPDPAQNSKGQAVESETKTVGPITKSVKYANGGAIRQPQYPDVDNRLRSAGLTLSGGGDVFRG